MAFPPQDVNLAALKIREQPKVFPALYACRDAEMPTPRGYREYKGPEMDTTPERAKVRPANH